MCLKHRRVVIFLFHLSTPAKQNADLPRNSPNRAQKFLNLSQIELNFLKIFPRALRARFELFSYFLNGVSFTQMPPVPRRRHPSCRRWWRWVSQLPPMVEVDADLPVAADEGEGGTGGGGGCGPSSCRRRWRWVRARQWRARASLVLAGLTRLFWQQQPPGSLSR
jgi:hypothetical protein